MRDCGAQRGVAARRRRGRIAASKRGPASSPKRRAAPKRRNFKHVAWSDPRSVAQVGPWVVWASCLYQEQDLRRAGGRQRHSGSDHGDVVCFELAVGRQQGERLDLRLRDQQAIEWIAVMGGEFGDTHGMDVLNR